MTVLLIAGSRTVYPTPEFIDEQGDGLLFVLSDVSLVVSGGAKGADAAGEAWAAGRGIEVQRFVPDYKALSGYLAPKMRNRAMAEFLNAYDCPMALIFWDGISGGATDMATRCVARGIPTRIVPTDPRRFPAGSPPPSNWGSIEWMQAQKRR